MEYVFCKKYMLQLQKYMRVTRLKDIDNSSIAEHSFVYKRVIDFNATKILHEELQMQFTQYSENYCFII